MSAFTIGFPSLQQLRHRHDTQYLWQYDNFGNRIAKLRFCPVQQSIGLTP
jgi:hypothetical protein